MAKKFTLSLDQGGSLKSYGSAQAQYSDVTLRRAFIVWAHCGAGINFHHVCRYYHRLEILESTYPLERKAMSRHLELDLFSSRPPSSSFLEETFPNLYKKGHADALLSKIEGVRSEQLIFHLHGFEHIDKAGSSKPDILDASNSVRRFCKERQITPSTFLVNFKSYLKVCDLVYSVNNLLVYLKKKAVQAEIELRTNMPIDYDFLHLDEADAKSKKKNKVVDDIKKSVQAKEEISEETSVEGDNENKENAIPLPYEQLCNLHVNDAKIASTTQNLSVMTNCDTKDKIDNKRAHKVIKNDKKASDLSLNDFNDYSLNDSESTKTSGVQITILRRNDKNNDLKQNFDESYSNVVTMKARTLLFS